MVKHPFKPVLFMILLPVSIGAGILGDFTIGKDLNARHGDPAIGFAIALTTFAILGWFLFFSEGPHQADSRFGSVLVVCGTLCILVALGLQFYLAQLTGENSRRVADLLLAKGGNVNLNVDYPVTVKAISYLAIFAGIGLAFLGIRVAIGRERDFRTAETEDFPPRPRPSSTSSESGYRSE